MNNESVLRTLQCLSCDARFRVARSLAATHCPKCGAAVVRTVPDGPGVNEGPRVGTLVDEEMMREIFGKVSGLTHKWLKEAQAADLTVAEASIAFCLAACGLSSACGGQPMEMMQLVVDFTAPATEAMRERTRKRGQREKKA